MLRDWWVLDKPERCSHPGQSPQKIGGMKGQQEVVL